MNILPEDSGVGLRNVYGIAIEVTGQTGSKQEVNSPSLQEGDHSNKLFSALSSYTTSQKQFVTTVI